MSQLYVLKLKHVSQGQSGLNRFFYLATQTGNSKELTEAFLQLVYPEIQATVCDKTLFTEVETQCLTSNVIPDFIMQINNGVGRIAGDELPAFNATGHQLQVASDIFRNGAKRIPGVPESQQVDGEPIPAYEILLQQAALFMYGVLIEAATDYLPGLAKTDDNGASWLFSQLISSVFKRLTTQNTRKVTSGGGTIDLLVPNGKVTWNVPSNNWQSAPISPASLLPYDNWVALGNQRVEGFVTTTIIPPANLT